MGDWKYFLLDNLFLASWGLGALFVAFLTRDKVNVAIGFFICFFVSYLTEMRTVGLSAAVGLASLVVLFGFRRFGLLFSLASITLFSIVLTFALGGLISEALLLNNPYRGISTGFAGRFV